MVKQEDKKKEENIPQDVADNKQVNIDVNANNNLKELVEKNIKWSQVIYEQNKKVNRRLTFMVVGSYLRLALVLVPIILGIIYLPSFFEQIWGKYNNLLEGSGDFTVNQISDITSQLNPSQIQEALKMIGR